MLCDLSTSAKGSDPVVVVEADRKFCNYVKASQPTLNYVDHNVAVGALSKAWVCGRWLAGIAGSNTDGSIVSVLCGVVEVSVSG